MKAVVRSFEDLPAVMRVDPHLVETLGISREKAYELANTEGFPSIRIGRRIVVLKAQLITWLEQQAGGASQVP